MITGISVPGTPVAVGSFMYSIRGSVSFLFVVLSELPLSDILIVINIPIPIIVRIKIIAIIIFIILLFFFLHKMINELYFYIFIKNLRKH